MNTRIRKNAKKEVFFDHYYGKMFPKELEYLTSKEGIDFLEVRGIHNLYELACYLLANNYHLEALLEDYLYRIDELIDDGFLSFDDDGTLDLYTFSHILEESYDQITDMCEEYEEEVDTLCREAFEVLGTQFTRKYGNILQSLFKEIAKNLTVEDWDMIDYYLPSYDSEKQKEIYNEYLLTIEESE